MQISEAACSMLLLLGIKDTAESGSSVRFAPNLHSTSPCLPLHANIGNWERESPHAGFHPITFTPFIQIVN